MMIKCEVEEGLLDDKKLKLWVKIFCGRNCGVVVGEMLLRVSADHSESLESCCGDWWLKGLVKRLG